MKLSPTPLRFSLRPTKIGALKYCIDLGCPAPFLKGAGAVRAGQVFQKICFLKDIRQPVNSAALFLWIAGLYFLDRESVFFLFAGSSDLYSALV